MSSKVQASAIAAAVGVILVWLLKTYAGVDVPDAVQAAGVLILAAIIGWIVPETNPAPSAVATVHRQDAARAAH
jgi:hypothetical protein